MKLFIEETQIENFLSRKAKYLFLDKSTDKTTITYLKTHLEDVHYFYSDENHSSAKITVSAKFIDILDISDEKEFNTGLEYIFSYWSKKYKDARKQFKTKHEALYSDIFLEYLRDIGFISKKTYNIIPRYICLISY